MSRALALDTPPNPPRGLTRRGLVRDLVLYGFASVAALACDYGLLLALTAHGAHYLLAQGASFLVGLAVSYGLSIRFVFGDRRGGSHAREALGFAATGLAGLLLTQILLSTFVEGLGLSVAKAKLPTVAIVFFFNFLARRGLIFATPSDARA